MEFHSVVEYILKCSPSNCVSSGTILGQTLERKRTRESVQQLERRKSKARHPHGYSTIVAFETNYRRWAQIFNYHYC
ncbi:hypothetical protein Y032_0704g1680 [Ancylostoma ceylanicum]|uniref:Uncharacterized protein n=1 Tax=Ancylostoma ceylanicum TaxID=53326 RepID=A0A016WH95_9BILA|nr:hypothetical protein Y032_0704g1680 [Ancylostoma ceylanicum]